MNLSKTTGYAIRILILLYNNRDTVVSSTAIHESLGIPKKYLWKIMNLLKSNTIIQSQKGKNGGYRLAKSAATIFLIDVVKTFQSYESVHQCVLGHSNCSILNPCPIHQYWETNEQKFDDMLKNVSIQKLTESS